MKIRLFPILALTLFLLPAQAQAQNSAVVVDTELAQHLYGLVDLDETDASVTAIAEVLNTMERPELEALIELLDTELSDAYYYYWKVTRQARDDGTVADFSGWRGTFLPGVDLDSRDRLTLLLGHTQRRLGDT